MFNVIHAMRLPRLFAPCLMFCFSVGAASTVYAAAKVSVADPTRPSGFTKKMPAAQVYRLESVMIGKTRELAFINGEAVAVGDRIGLGVVQSISSHQVVVVGNKKHILTMGQGLRKLPSENRR